MDFPNQVRLPRGDKVGVGLHGKCVIDGHGGATACSVTNHHTLNYLIAVSSTFHDLLDSRKVFFLLNVWPRQVFQHSLALHKLKFL
jgi:hypothetical protein